MRMKRTARREMMVVVSMWSIMEPAGEVMLTFRGGRVGLLTLESEDGIEAVDAWWSRASSLCGDKPVVAFHAKYFGRLVNP